MIIFLALVIIVVNYFDMFKEFRSLTTTIRVLRVARMLRLFVKAKKLQIIFQTIVEASSTLGSLGFLLMLSIYMFSIIGVQLFALVDLHRSPGIDAELDNHTNFQCFLNAFMTMLRCATGENWNQIMFDCAKQHDILYQCNAGESYETIVKAGRDPTHWEGPRGCGSQLDSILFHLIFQVVITQIFLNLFIAVIIDAFMGVSEAYDLPISRVAVIEFEEVWAKHCDVQNEYFMNIRQLDTFFYQLSHSDEAD